MTPEHKGDNVLIPRTIQNTNQQQLTMNYCHSRFQWGGFMTIRITNWSGVAKIGCALLVVFFNQFIVLRNDRYV